MNPINAKLIFLRLNNQNHKDFPDDRHIEIPNKLIPGHSYYVPILISETDKIEKGDWYLTFDGDEFHYPIGSARQCENTNYNFAYCKKILALPAQVSPTILELIINEKLKNGDPVLLESTSKLKLDSNNHVILYLSVKDQTK